MFVKVTNGQVDRFPYTIGDLRRENPTTSFPKQLSNAILSEHNIHSVTISERPTFDGRTQRLTQNEIPQSTDSGWVIGWTIVDKTSDQIQEYDDKIAKSVRDHRNTLLAETDYFALTDVTMDAAMTTYRQALRDITAHDNWPNLESGDWPTKP